MNKKLIYIVLLLIFIISCEEIYEPDLESVDDCLVVEAIFIANSSYNTVYLHKSTGFNDQKPEYEPVTGALVYLNDENGNFYECREDAPGAYGTDLTLEKEKSYNLLIKVGQEIYKSENESIPQIPALDSIYGEYITKISTTGAVNSTEDIISTYGIQLYADMNYKGDLNHYRFYSRKILQYTDHYDTIIWPEPEPERRLIYGWKSYYPAGIFNIAGPPAYSTEKNISKHQLDFFPDDYNKFIADTQLFAGWIYILYQYGLNENTFNNYKDLNSQLGAEGKIFDPVYVQARSNITCTSDRKKVVLGSFEISSVTEHRFFMQYYRTAGNFRMRRISQYFDIPEQGYIKDIMPEFWELPKSSYTDE